MNYWIEEICNHQKIKVVGQIGMGQRESNGEIGKSKGADTGQMNSEWGAKMTGPVNLHLGSRRIHSPEISHMNQTSSTKSGNTLFTSDLHPGPNGARSKRV